MQQHKQSLHHCNVNKERENYLKFSGPIT